MADHLALCRDAAKVRNGRMSFPSGHSSTAFSGTGSAPSVRCISEIDPFLGLGFLFLFLAGKTGACCLTAPPTQSGPLSSRLLKLIFTVSPLLFASWIAISRLEDYVSMSTQFQLHCSHSVVSQRHHKEDIIVGSIIGFSSAYLTYTIYWQNPFSSRLYSLGTSSQPRLVYDSSATPISAEDYELANYEDDERPQDVEARPR